MDERMEGRMVMEGRRKLTLTGAKEVLRFDEELAELSTALGNLTIEGTGMKLKTLSLDTGTVVVEGELRCFSYEEPRLRRGWRRCPRRSSGSGWRVAFWRVCCWALPLMYSAPSTEKRPVFASC